MNMKKTNLLFVLSAFLVSACSERTIDPLCDGRARALQPNNASAALMHMTYHENKTIDVTLSFSHELPASEKQRLDKPEMLFSAGGSQSCNLTNKDVDASGDKLVANYQYSCGDDNPLKEVDITLLDQLASIDEVEAYIKTDAVAKHFVISRQCNKPIFNLPTADAS